MERKVIVIVGPTASGKSSVAIDLAEKCKTEIISADSRQIYKHLDIGTAKPSVKELRKIKHHFVDELEPDEIFNASRFEVETEEIINDLLNQKKIPIVAGGTGLYISALIDGITDIATDEEIRNELNKKRNEFGDEYLYNELKKVDPESAGKMLPQNWKRVMRALEVYYITGKAISHWHQQTKAKDKYEFYQFGLKWNREQLYNRIGERVDRMVEERLVYEVKEILSMGFTKNHNALNSVGYKEIISYLNNEITLERAVELIKRNSRRYAKRQMTWFNADKRINWIPVNSESQLEEASKYIYNKVLDER